MVSYDWADPWDASAKGAKAVNALFDQRAQLKAGNALASGDYGAASGELYRGGLLDEGYAVQKIGRAEDERGARVRAAQAYAGGDYSAAKDAYAGIGDMEGVGTAEEGETAQRKKQLDFTLKAAKSIRDRLKRGGVQGAVQAYDELMPAFQQMGTDPGQLKQFRDALASNPEGFLDTVETAAGQEARKLSTEKIGDELLVFEDGNPDPIRRYSQNQRVLGEGQRLVDIGDGGSSGAPAPTGVGGDPNTDDVFGALIMQESGGQPGVLGPQTKYGRAEGMTQMLPETAREMAQKTGTPWRPELMRGTTPEAARYQQTLGRAYFEEGLQKYGGDVAKALMYYHGGPDERLWGPKTQTYAREVMGRLQSARTAGPGAPTGGGSRVIAEGAPKGVEWEDRGGYLENPVTGDRKTDPESGRNGGGLPAPLQKAEDEDLDAIGSAASIQTDIGSLRQQLQTNSLDLGPVRNVLAGARNWAGRSDENSRNYATFRATLEKMRNDSLRLNKGVQTEGDAVRAWNELFNSLNDEKVVLQRLGEIEAINGRAVEHRTRILNNRRKSRNLDPLDISEFVDMPPAVGQGGASPPSGSAPPPRQVQAGAGGGGPKPPSGLKKGKGGYYGVEDPSRPGSFPAITWNGSKGRWEMTAANGDVYAVED